MRLKKLELHGFKSFADRTCLVFDEGITAVVGPNGCGKSNISDAVRWVLGEQSVKSLRGGKMLDVIFAGTSTRAPLGFAEVTVTFTDVAETLPIDYEEVAITRRLHRSGESEYLINRQPVRLKDVRNLFLDSGIGKISIFEQGKIEDIYRASPKDRRKIIEGAAGILRFLERKHEATRDLGKADDNMTRILDIYKEVEKQIDVSEKQAAAATQYKSNQSELERLEKALCLAKWGRFDDRLKQVQFKDAEFNENLTDTVALLRLLGLQLEQARSEQDQSEMIFRVRSEAVYKARSSRAISEKERLSNKERLKEATEKQQSYSKDLRDVRNKREAERVAMEHSKKRLQSLERDVFVQDEALQVSRNRSKKAQRELVALRESQQYSQQERIELVQSEAQADAQLKENKVRLEGTQERLSDLASRYDRGQKWGAELASESEMKKKALKEATDLVDTKRALFVQLEASRDTLTENLEKKAHERELLSTELAELRARQKALNKLKEDMEGLSEGTKVLLREANDPASPLHKKLRPLHEELSPLAGCEAAVAAVMRPYLQTILVDTERDLGRLLKLAEDMELTDYSVLCLEHLRAPVIEGIQRGDARPLVECVLDHGLAPHFLGDCSLVKEGQGSLALTKDGEGTQLVTSSGILRDERGVLFVMSQGAHNAFLRQAELKSLEQRLLDLEKGLEKLSEAVAILQRKKAEFDQERGELDQILRRGEMKVVEVNFGVQQCKQALEKHLSEFAAVEEERAKMELLVKELTASIRDLQLRHNELSTRAQERGTQLAKLDRQLKDAEKGFEQVEEERQEFELEFKKLSDEFQQLGHALKVFKVKEEEGIQHEERLQSELVQLDELQKKLSAAEAKAQAALGSVQEELTGVEAEVQALEDEVKYWKERVRHVEGNILLTREQVRVLEEERHQQGVKIAQLQSQRDVVQQDLFERHQLTVGEAQKLKLNLKMPIEDAEKRVRHLRREIDRAGDVNMTAIDAYEEQRIRQKALKRQIDDMDSSKKELMDIIAQLDGESRKIFTEAFAAIRENFQKNFRILFNGGEADLTFTDSKDVLEAGIEIVAKPPGKRMRSIQLLSGGEKCLTAMALLFAIFEVKPAPFCILDEIDAPLDDSNVVRFVNVVKQFVDKSQFIIITHNKRTMAIADTLFGVSMEERGVSKLLSMKFSEAAEHAEEPLATVH